MTLERILLQTIKFDLQVEHPYALLVKYAKSVKGKAFTHFPATHHSYFIGPHSTVCNISGYRCVPDSRSRGREFDPSTVPYFCGDKS